MGDRRSGHDLRLRDVRQSEALARQISGNRRQRGVLDPERTIQIGIRGNSEYLWEFSYDSGMTVVHAEEVFEMGLAAVIRRAREVTGDGPTYISFDIDSLDPAFAPGTGTPEVGGLSSADALAILRGCMGLDIVGGDVVEVAPHYDPKTNTAQAAGQVLFAILCLAGSSLRARRTTILPGS
jgi:guanidinopropionase